MNLREIRIGYNLSQADAAHILGVPVRTYRRYESDEQYGSSIKRDAFVNILNSTCQITEDRGLLSVEIIKDKLTKLFDEEYKDQIEFCYLFGSYAKGCARENSDVDLYVSSSLTGLKFVGLMEKIRQILHKKVDVIRSSELNNNITLVNEIMKGGIKIYG